MKESIFRKKSLDKISSPEDLNSYMRVANPSVWIILIAIILVLVGGIVWGVVGSMDSTVPGLIVSDGTDSVLYISENNIDKVSVGKNVELGDEEYEITKIGNPELASSSMSTYSQHEGGFLDGEYVYSCEFSGSVAEGSYACDVVIESVSAISFLWN